MESIGQKLSSAREALGFSIEQIARETNIAKSYLTALEQEDFNTFPGETYLLGFLRNYSEYLSLDPEEMVTLYRNMKIQEQPSPMEELLVIRKPVPRAVVIIIIAAVVLALGAVGYFYVYPNYIEGRVPAAPKPAAAETAEPEAPAQKVTVKDTYEFADEVIEKRFRKNDGISVKLKDQSYLVVISNISDTVTFIHPRGETSMKAGDEALIDLDGDGAADIRMLLRSLDSSNNSIVLHVDRFVQPSGAAKTDTAAADEDHEPVIPAVTEENTGRAGVPSRIVKTAVVREAARTEPFTLNIVFRGYCLLRYESAESGRQERYFRRGETFRLDVNSEVKLWASNAGSISGKINGADIDLGGSGEVSSSVIRWIYNKDSLKYELQIIPMY